LVVAVYPLTSNAGKETSSREIKVERERLLIVHLFLFHSLMVITVYIYLSILL